MKEIYENRPAQWLDVDEINNQHNWYKNINYQEDLKEIEH